MSGYTNVALDAFVNILWLALTCAPHLLHVQSFILDQRIIKQTGYVWYLLHGFGFASAVVLAFMRAMTQQVAPETGADGADLWIADLSLAICQSVILIGWVLFTRKKHISNGKHDAAVYVSHTPLSAALVVVSFGCYVGEFVTAILIRDTVLRTWVVWCSMIPYGAYILALAIGVVVTVATGPYWNERGGVGRPSARAAFGQAAAAGNTPSLVV